MGVLFLPKVNPSLSRPVISSSFLDRFLLCAVLHFISLSLQLQTFAVMPADGGAAATESDDFMAHVTTAFPGTADHWVSYASESEFLDVVGDSDYSMSDELPAFSAGVVFTSGSPDWAYTVGVEKAWPQDRELSS